MEFLDNVHALSTSGIIGALFTDGGLLDSLGGVASHLANLLGLLK
ncbi:MAG: porin [Corynebacterium glutamicum]|nr:porin [Corynebacterium glutamicum]